MKKTAFILLFLLTILLLSSSLADYEYPWPVDTKYVLNTGYLYGRQPDGTFHTGIDITRNADGSVHIPEGEPIYAPISGTANYYYRVKNGALSSFGNYCVITSGNISRLLFSLHSCSILLPAMGRSALTS